MGVNVSKKDYGVFSDSGQSRPPSSEKDEVRDLAEANSKVAQLKTILESNQDTINTLHSALKQLEVQNDKLKTEVLESNAKARSKDLLIADLKGELERYRAVSSKSAVSTPSIGVRTGNQFHGISNPSPMSVEMASADVQEIEVLREQLKQARRERHAIAQEAAAAMRVSTVESHPVGGLELIVPPVEDVVVVCCQSGLNAANKLSAYVKARHPALTVGVMMGQNESADNVERHAVSAGVGVVVVLTAGSLQCACCMRACLLSDAATHYSYATSPRVLLLHEAESCPSPHYTEMPRTRSKEVASCFNSQAVPYVDSYADHVFQFVVMPWLESGGAGTVPSPLAALSPSIRKPSHFPTQRSPSFLQPETSHTKLDKLEPLGLSSESGSVSRLGTPWHAPTLALHEGESTLPGAVPRHLQHQGLIYRVFLSHCRTSATTRAAVHRIYQELKGPYAACLDAKVADSVEELQQLVERVRASHTVLVYLSDGYLESRWCLTALCAALSHGAQVVWVRDAYFALAKDFDAEGGFFDSAMAQVAKLWTSSDPRALQIRARLVQAVRENFASGLVYHEELQEPFKARLQGCIGMSDHLLEFFTKPALEFVSFEDTTVDAQRLVQAYLGALTAQSPRRLEGVYQVRYKGHFRQDECTQLIRLFEQNETLSSLDLEQCRMEVEGVRAVGSLLARSRERRERVLHHLKWPKGMLLKAISRKDTRAVAYLLDLGVDPNSPTECDKEGNPALSVAACEGNADIVAALVKARAQVNAHQGRDRGKLEEMMAKTDLWFHESALHKAAAGGHGRAVSVLLQAGAAVDARANINWATPLHLAAAESCHWQHSDPEAAYAEVVSSLLQAGADVFAKDKHGLTPLATAESRNQNQRVLALLREWGKVSRSPDNPTSPTEKDWLGRGPKDF